MKLGSKKKKYSLMALMVLLLIIGILFKPNQTSAYISQSDTSANVVVGQADFTSNTANQGRGAANPLANTLNNIYGVYSDGTRFFVADSANNRILIYNSIPTADNASANVAVGQPNLTSATANNGGRSAGTLNFPTFVFSDGKKLFVADFANNRVLIYNTIPTSNNASANVVIGQADFTSGTANQGRGGANPLANTLYQPIDVFSDGTRLFIADSANNRILIYNTIPTTNNASADVVVGQANFTSAGINQGRGANNPLANTLRGAFGIYSNGQKLILGDNYNHRVLIYNTIPTANNASADVVVGQADFTSAGINQGRGANSPLANTLAYPQAIYSDGNRLFVPDYGNSRALIYNSIPTASNASADVVVGQADFTSAGINQGRGANSPLANTLYWPTGISSGGNRLFVSDGANNRVLIYNLAPNSTSVSIGSGSQSDSHSVALTLAATGANEMMLSNYSDFRDGVWETYATSKQWSLAAGDSVKTVYAKFRDWGQFESVAASASIDFGTTPATILTLPETGSDTKNRNIILQILIFAGTITMASLLYYLVRKRYLTLSQKR